MVVDIIPGCSIMPHTCTHSAIESFLSVSYVLYRRMQLPLPPPCHVGTESHCMVDSADSVFTWLLSIAYPDLS